MRASRQLFLTTHLAAFAFIAAICLSPSVSRAQTDAEQDVQTAWNLAQQGRYTGVQEKRLGRLGDASAVELMKLLADKPLGDADIPAILLVVRLSYNFPKGVEETTNREPRATLYLLRSLSLLAKTPKTHALIDETTAYVKSQYAEYLQSHPGE